MDDVAPDPLAELDEAALRRLARRADRVRSRPGGIDRVAERVGVERRRVRLLADAWAEGGAFGVAALGPAPADTDAEALRRADGAVEAWRRRHFPLEALRWETWRNRITVWHLLPGQDRLGDLERRPMAQLRLTRDGRWHLYSKAAQGEWWPVVVKGRRGEQTVADCLEAVRNDGAGRFWTTHPPAGASSEPWFRPG